jgi:hypothetical protein
MHSLTFRKVRGLLVGGAVFAAVLLGSPGPADAAPVPDPMASFCAPMNLASWYADPLQLCRQALQQMRAGRRQATTTPPVHSGRSTGHLAVRRRPPLPRPVARPRKAAQRPVGRSAGASAAAVPAAPQIAHAQGGATDETGPATPNLLIWLLLPLIGAIAFALHRMVLVPAGVTAFRGVARELEPEFVAAPSGVDPLIVPGALGLGGPGAVDAARFMVLNILEAGPAPGVLVVIPRAEANLLFGLGEDELVDTPGGPLFLPGTLDGALSYLETDLADRERHERETPRLVLVAGADSNTADSTDRIKALADRYPVVLSILVTGDWPDNSVTIDEDGAVTAAAGVPDTLPARLPALSRTESRDRLTALLRR